MVEHNFLMEAKQSRASKDYKDQLNKEVQLI